MSVLYVMLPIALIIACGAVLAFIRAVRAGQYDDLDTPALRMLIDDDEERGRGRRSNSTGLADDAFSGRPDGDFAASAGGPSH